MIFISLFSGGNGKCIKRKKHFFRIRLGIIYIGWMNNEKASTLLINALNDYVDPVVENVREIKKTQ